MSLNSKELYRKELCKTIQDLAKDLIELAPDFVGDGDLICNFEIRLKFPLRGVPSIELIREHYSAEYHKRRLENSHTHTRPL